MGDFRYRIMIYISSFRQNDLNSSKGKQIEFNKKVATEFFRFDKDSYRLTFMCYSLQDLSIQSQINVFLRLSPQRGDYKIYQNEDGSKNLKDFLISDLGLTIESNLSDYFAIIRKGDNSYDFCYIPKDSLFDNFINWNKRESYVLLNQDKDEFQIPSNQVIYYGAPGTGKSSKIKKILEDKNVPKENIFRTTFHPDSDYSSFVGAYKPTMDKPIEKIYVKGELISKLTAMKNEGITYSPQKFGAKYWRSLKQLNLYDKKDILQACGMSDNYIVEFDKGMAIGEEYLACSNESNIIYSFVPQTFLNAYLRAYQKTDEDIYLVIEEINRGNCAQIFGDLFQLLDRDLEGKSDYTIKADTDLRAYLEEKLGTENEGIKNGELCLPPNLYIFATMNTSDQSLFPIDSAFKRRWDWEYEPIKYKNKDWKIVVGDKEYSWVSFQKIVNDRIFDSTNSEDKMLGDYFVHPHDGVVTEKMLLNKVLFYLWNDVCKDGEGDIFKTSDTEEVTFSELYGAEGQRKLMQMLEALGIELVSDTTNETDKENTDEVDSDFRYS